MKIIGKVISIGEVASGVSAKTGNNWKRCQFVIETLETQQKLVLESYNDRVFDNLQLDIKREFEIAFNADQYNGKWYNHINCRSMNSLDGNDTGNSNNGGAAPGANPAPEPTPTEGKADGAKKPEADKGLQEKTDDLPF